MRRDCLSLKLIIQIPEYSEPRDGYQGIKWESLNSDKIDAEFSDHWQLNVGQLSEQ